LQKDLEYFSQNPETTDGSPVTSLGKRLFTTRLEIVGELGEKLASESPGRAGAEVGTGYEPRTDAELGRAVGEVLHKEVAAMNLDNFVVRPHRRVVE
jgi:type I restriction enzyme R subunit